MLSQIGTLSLETKKKVGYIFFEQNQIQKNEINFILIRTWNILFGKYGKSFGLHFTLLDHRKLKL